jgi:putative SOS response-associated peptidase YedK
MRTINCRDDSLIDNRGMWTSMKKRKRCIVICQGFYEWLKKNNGKEKIPHYIKRKDNKLFCFAGLWDVVTYEDREEKNYTYSIITTDSNKQLKWLHDRMPVVFNPGSEEIRTWLDPNRYEWSKELQSLLKPFDGELEIYPVNKDVGKVGNESTSFIIPIDSSENKRNIANFFSKPGIKPSKVDITNEVAEEDHVKKEETAPDPTIKIKAEDVADENSESNAPLLFSPLTNEKKRGIKRELSPTGVEGDTTDNPTSPKAARLSQLGSPSHPKASRKMHSATSNSSLFKSGSPSKKANGSQKITSFFTKSNG